MALLSQPSNVTFHSPVVPCGSSFPLCLPHFIHLKQLPHNCCQGERVGKSVSRWAVNDEHEWIFLPALRLFRFGSNTSVNREPLSPKDFYSSHDVFLEKKPLVSSQITTFRHLLFLPLCVAGPEDTHIHCESTCVSVQAVCVLSILSAVTDKDSGTRSGPLSLRACVELTPRKLLSAFGLRWIFLLLPSFVWW